jgi:hypothetical protein
MTGWTSPDQLPFPDDYNQPADVPADVEALAVAVQNALNGKAPSTSVITAGSGLTGGGDLSASRTLSVGAGTGVAVAADSVGLDLAYTDGRYAKIASPALTGNPTAPTPAAGDNDTSIATTAFVNAEIGLDAVLRAHVRTGAGVVPIANNAITGFVDVTWPALPAEPRVVATVQNTSVWIASVSAVTATGCRLTLRHVDAAFSGTAYIPVDFIAMYGLG